MKPIKTFHSFLSFIRHKYQIWPASWRYIWGAAVIQRVVALSSPRAVSLAVYIIYQNLLYSLVILTRPGSREVYF